MVIRILVERQDKNTQNVITKSKTVGHIQFLYSSK